MNAPDQHPTLFITIYERNQLGKTVGTVWAVRGLFDAGGLLCYDDPTSERVIPWGAKPTEILLFQALDAAGLAWDQARGVEDYPALPHRIRSVEYEQALPGSEMPGEYREKSIVSLAQIPRFYRRVQMQETEPVHSVEYSLE